MSIAFFSHDEYFFQFELIKYHVFDYLVNNSTLKFFQISIEIIRLFLKNKRIVFCIRSINMLHILRVWRFVSHENVVHLVVFVPLNLTLLNLYRTATFNHHFVTKINTILLLVWSRTLFLASYCSLNSRRVYRPLRVRFPVRRQNIICSIRIQVICVCRCNSSSRFEWKWIDSANGTQIT